MNKKLYVLLHPSRLLAAFMGRYCTWLPDEIFLRCRYRLLMHKRLHLEPPVTFTEKIQWLKLNDRKPIYSLMADKYDVKEYVANRIGKQYIIPTLGVWDSFDEIDFSQLPNQFVLKSTNGGGGTGVVICRDKSKIDKEAAKKLLNFSLNTPASKVQGEWVYKNIKPRLIAESFLSTTENSELLDYKFFCFNGKVRCFKVDFGRFTTHHANYYDETGALLPFGETICPPDFNHKISIPDSLSKMIELAEKLAEGHIFLRVDLYNVNSQIYFGECTFYPNSGFGEFTPKEWDYTLGTYLELPMDKDRSPIYRGGVIFQIVRKERKEARQCA